MTTLYHSPNVIIDAHEWHAIVRKKNGRVTLTYRWRPVSFKQYEWRPITSWQGPKPKAFGARMAGFRRHIAAALQSEAVRAEAVKALSKRVPTGAALRNVGLEELAGAA